MCSKYWRPILDELSGQLPHFTRIRPAGRSENGEAFPDWIAAGHDASGPKGGRAVLRIEQTAVEDRDYNGISPAHSRSSM
jgi:hypothetical protein